MKVTKAGSVVSYFDKSGNLLVSEDSKEMIAATVLGVNTNTCIATFNSPASERLYGLESYFLSQIALISREFSCT